MRGALGVQIGETPLHVAAKNGRMLVVDRLIKARCHVYQQEQVSLSEDCDGFGKPWGARCAVCQGSSFGTGLCRRLEHSLRNACVEMGPWEVVWQVSAALILRLDMQWKVTGAPECAVIN